MMQKRKWKTENSFTEGDIVDSYSYQSYSFKGPIHTYLPHENTLLWTIIMSYKVFKSHVLFLPH